MRNSYVFDEDRINEGKLRNEALERLREDPSDRTTIHLHGQGQLCNSNCYLVKPHVTESEKRRGK